ncbi:hypothetical protein FB451DRAFT_1187405 [Mycena latifolia]|nr:hypothetical protein FB451DRAFT_1187405 [Mycena latifolia]
MAPHQLSVMGIATVLQAHYWLLVLQCNDARYPRSQYEGLKRKEKNGTKWWGSRQGRLLLRSGTPHLANPIQSGLGPFEPDEIADFNNPRYGKGPTSRVHKVQATSPLNGSTGSRELDLSGRDI